MELTVRDWMVIIGVLLILAVALDAARRIRSERYSRVRVKLVDPEEPTPVVEVADDQLFWPRELPNGGARVIHRGDPRAAATDSPPQDEVQPAPPETAPETADGDDVPLITGMSALDESDAGAADSAAEKNKQPRRRKRPAARKRGKAAAEQEPAQPARAEQPADDEPRNLDWLDNIDMEEPPPEPEDEAGRLPRGVQPEVFMLNVLARSPDGFRGDDILHILLACDLRFGDMNFFHRHEFEAGRGAIQFSVANMMQPGVFDIDNMADFTTPGLVFFVTLPGPEDMMQAFDYMLETAQAVARNLDGDVLDESRSAITRQTLEHCRQQIRDLERRMLARTPG